METQTTPLTSNESVIERLKHFNESFNAVGELTPENKSGLAALLTNKSEITIEDMDIFRAVINAAFQLIDADEAYNKQLASINRKLSRAKSTKNLAREMELKVELKKLDERFNKKRPLAIIKTNDEKFDREINAFMELMQ